MIFLVDRSDYSLLLVTDKVNFFQDPSSPADIPVHAAPHHDAAQYQGSDLSKGVPC